MSNHGAGSSPALPPDATAPDAAPADPRSADAVPAGGGELRRLREVPGLDGVRAVAVAAVVVTHLTIVAPDVRHLLPAGGFLGVDVFFVLSGFLITSLLLGEQAATGGIRLGAFARRRAVRLLPALVAVLAAHAAWAAVVGLPADVERASIVAALLQVFNWDVVLNLRAAEGLGHLWSLSIEGQFYLVWPLVALGLMALGRRVRPAPVVVVTAGVVAVVVWRLALLADGAGWLVLYARTDTRLDALLIGAALAWVWRHRWHPTGRVLAAAAWSAAALLAAAFVVASETDLALYRGGLTVVAAAAAVVVLAVVEGSWAPARWLASRPLRAVGRVSYGTYLWHFPILWAVARAGTSWPAPVRIGLALALTGAAAWGSWILVEQPAQRWRARRTGRRPSEPPEVLPPPMPEGPAIAPNGAA
jgi:peptidoglycan/LPS O-acetylase OafA/YrhL